MKVVETYSDPLTGFEVAVVQSGNPQIPYHVVARDGDGFTYVAGRGSLDHASRTASVLLRGKSAVEPLLSWL